MYNNIKKSGKYPYNSIRICTIFKFSNIFWSPLFYLLTISLLYNNIMQYVLYDMHHMNNILITN